MKFHNYTGHPVQIITEEPGHIIDLPPEKPPFEIAKIEKIRTIVPISIEGGENLHIAIEKNRVALKSVDGFPGPQPEVLYLVPQIIVEAVRKTNRSTTRDLIVPEQNMGIGPFQLHYANIITELDLNDPDTENAMFKTWQNSANSIEGYKYPHESYASDR